MLAAADDQPHRRAHRRQVGADVDSIGDKQQPDQDHDDRAGKDLRHVRRESAARHPADAGTHRLDRDHHRPSQYDGPKQVEARLGAGLRIGGDAARIVVSCPGDYAGAEALEQASQVQAFGYVGQIKLNSRVI
jgi:hypothetical protein